MKTTFGSPCGLSLLFLTITKFTAEISENEITFLDTVVFKGERFIKESILDIKTHYLTTSRRKPFNIPILPRATLRG